MSDWAKQKLRGLDERERAEKLARERDANQLAQLNEIAPRFWQELKVVLTERIGHFNKLRPDYFNLSEGNRNVPEEAMDIQTLTVKCLRGTQTIAFRKW
jgi:hypothetical protein